MHFNSFEGIKLDNKYITRRSETVRSKYVIFNPFYILLLVVNIVQLV